MTNAACVRAAYSGDEPVHTRDAPGARFLSIAASRLQPLRWLALVALIGLTYFERPTYDTLDIRSVSNTSLFFEWHLLAWSLSGIYTKLRKLQNVCSLFD